MKANVSSILRYITKKCIRILKHNYDFCFLTNKLKKTNKDYNKKIIVTGLSYSMFGIEDRLLKYNAINLSFPSQDIYYSYRIAQHIIEKNKNIEYCIIGSSYYSLHFDLSSSKNENFRVRDFYYPILKDAHNCTQLNKEFKKSSIFPKINILAILSRSYFNFIIKREAIDLINREKNLSEVELFQLGKNRALDHNRMLKYHNTVDENVMLMDEFINMLLLNNIEPILVVFPASIYYRKYLNEEFSTVYYNYIRKLLKKYEFEFVDLFNDKEFCLDDFVDFDHLNKKGAIKMTNIINKYLDLPLEGHKGRTQGDGGIVFTSKQP